MARATVSIPNNARALRRVRLELPDGRTAYVGHYRSSNRRSEPAEWVAIGIYAGDERVWRTAEQFSGNRIEGAAAEFEQTLAEVREAGVTSETDITNGDDDR